MIKFVIAVFVGLLLAPHRTFAATRVPGHDITYPPSHFEWADFPLTGNDKPYQAAMAKIDKELAGGQQPEALWDHYHGLAVLNPKDPMPQFCDAYTLWASRTKLLTYPRDWYTKRREAFHTVANEMLKTRDPYTYEFSRIHLFVVLRGEGYTSPKYENLAFRLIKINSNDIPLKADILSFMSYPLTIDRDILVRYGKEVIVAWPNNPGAYGADANMYYWQLDKSHSKADADRALADAQMQLKLCKPGDITSFSVPVFIRNLKNKMTALNIQ